MEEEEEIEGKLDVIFRNVNDWLKFAEQKNASLLILNGGIVWGVTRILSNMQCSFNFFHCFNATGYILIILSSLMCIISFLPVLQIPWFKIDKKSKSDNCFYFAHLAKYSSQDYLVLLVNKLGYKQREFTGYELDLSAQIVANSEVALDKYKSFKVSSILTIFSVVTFFLAIVFCYYGE